MVHGTLRFIKSWLITSSKERRYESDESENVKNPMALQKLRFMAEFISQIKAKCLGVLLLLCLWGQPVEAFDRRTPVVQAIQIVGPAVVNISSEVEVQRRSRPFAQDPFFDNFFSDFFEPRNQKRSSLGSGVIIDGRRGFILTNAHVIEARAVIKVLLHDERQFEAQIIGMDPDSDLAVLKIVSESALPAVAMGDSDGIMIGETVIAIGNPFGFSHTVTTGVVSAVDRSIKTDERVFHEFIQTDASINPGNSGGPLLNINGELIGINTAIYAKAQGIGFAIPINKAKRIVSDLIRYGHVLQNWIGLIVQDIDNAEAHYLNLKTKGGALISHVEKDSPAAKAGFDPGDLILAVNGRNIASGQDYNTATRDIPVGEKITIQFRRNNRDLSLTVNTIVFPEDLAPELTWRRLGIKIDTNEKTRQRGRSSVTEDGGVTISAVRKGSELDRIGVTPGYVVRQIDDARVSTPKDFFSTVLSRRNKESVTIVLQRRNQIYRIPIALEP
jgi:Do/DeqQ family serine protease